MEKMQVLLEMLLLLLTSFIYYHIVGDNVYPINLALVCDATFHLSSSVLCPPVSILLSRSSASLFSSISASVRSGSFSNRSENHASPIHSYKEGSDAHSHPHVQQHSNYVNGSPANLTINPPVMFEVDMTLSTAPLSKTLHFKHTDHRIHTDQR